MVRGIFYSLYCMALPLSVREIRKHGSQKERAPIINITGTVFFPQIISDLFSVLFIRLSIDLNKCMYYILINQLLNQIA